MKRLFRRENKAPLESESTQANPSWLFIEQKLIPLTRQFWDEPEYLDREFVESLLDDFSLLNRLVPPLTLSELSQEIAARFSAKYQEVGLELLTRVMTIIFDLDPNPPKFDAKPVDGISGFYEISVTR